jgi:DNA-binding SARP family transcriptional activator
MLTLRTIGSISIEVDGSRIPQTNQQVHSALVYLVINRGKLIPRRTLGALFFPNAADDNASHSLRQLIYRVRKFAPNVDSTSSDLRLQADSATWDVDAILTRGHASPDELKLLAFGYLPDYCPQHSPTFAQWLEDHRSDVTATLRGILVRQLQSVRSRNDYASLETVARACLALDPFNEEATLAAAESLAMTGSKMEALALLDDYVAEVGSRAPQLRVSPRLLRERISEYFIESAPHPNPRLIGRDAELTSLLEFIQNSKSGACNACIITGPSGIGKSRLLAEGCALAALAGHAVVRTRLHPHDSHRPFAILGDLGAALLELPGSLGASPEALATVRGLCGLGPSTFTAMPKAPHDIHAVVAAIHSHVVELIDAIAGEQALVVCVEDGQWIDEASTELLAELLDNRRAVSILIASQRKLDFPLRAATTPRLFRMNLLPLNQEQSSSVLSNLFLINQRQTHDDFVRLATRLSGGVPFYLHLLFRSFQSSGDVTGVPPALAAAVETRITELDEASRTVFDAIVVLGAHCSEGRLEALTQLPRYALMGAVRDLDERGLIRFSDEIIAPTHDIFADACRKRMPVMVSRLLNRASAVLLEDDPKGVEPLAIATHWLACGEEHRAVSVLIATADRSMQLGRPRDAIALIEAAQKNTLDANTKREVDLRLFSACAAAGEHVEAAALAERLALIAGSEGVDLQVKAIANLYAGGRSIVAYASVLEGLAADRSHSFVHRAYAARLLVIIAEDLFDRQMGEAAMQSIEDMPHESDAMYARLIFETAFGSSNNATRLAIQTCELMLGDQPDVARLLALHNASNVLMRFGHMKAATEYMQRGYAVAERSKIWSTCAGFSAMIAEMYWLTGERGPAAEWFKIALHHLPRASASARAAQVMGLAIMFALEEGDPTKAEHLLEEAERTCPRVGENRFAVERLAYITRISMARGETPSESDVHELLRMHKTYRGSGLQDMATDTLIAALVALKRSEEAISIRNDYLSAHRRDGFPIPPQLKFLAS